ncbi:hypothetical protein OWM07_08995 [Deferribacter thermophilus]|uniref:phasin family protein n=1 Tax=Deferribacter thermophilus TaxID=53573 RepID=UPI003C1F6DB2
MNELAKKFIVLGLGLAAMTEEKAKAFYDNVIKKGEQSLNQDSKFLKDVVENFEKNSKEVEEIIEKMLKSFADKMGLVTKNDLKKFEVKLAEIESKVERLNREIEAVKEGN